MLDVLSEGLKGCWLNTLSFSFFPLSFLFLLSYWDFQFLLLPLKCHIIIFFLLHNTPSRHYMRSLSIPVPLHQTNIKFIINNKQFSMPQTLWLSIAYRCVVFIPFEGFSLADDAMGGRGWNGSYDTWLYFYDLIKMVTDPWTPRDAKWNYKYFFFLILPKYSIRKLSAPHSRPHSTCASFI